MQVPITEQLDKLNKQIKELDNKFKEMQPKLDAIIRILGTK